MIDLLMIVRNRDTRCVLEAQVRLIFNETLQVLMQNTVVRACAL